MGRAAGGGGAGHDRHALPHLWQCNADARHSHAKHLCVPASAAQHPRPSVWRLHYEVRHRSCWCDAMSVVVVMLTHRAAGSCDVVLRNSHRVLPPQHVFVAQHHQNNQIASSTAEWPRLKHTDRLTLFTEHTLYAKNAACRTLQASLRTSLCNSLHVCWAAAHLQGGG